MMYFLLTTSIEIHSTILKLQHCNMPLTDKDRRIAYSIVRHLQVQVERGDISEDAAEGIMSKSEALSFNVSINRDNAERDEVFCFKICGGTSLLWTLLGQFEVS